MFFAEIVQFGRPLKVAVDTWFIINESVVQSHFLNPVRLNCIEAKMNKLQNYQFALSCST